MSRRDAPLDLPADLRRGRVRSVDWTRVTRGMHRRIAADEDGRWELQGFLAALPSEAVLTGLTAARVRGWWLPRLPDDVPVFAATLAGAGQTRRPGVRLARLTVPPVAEAVGGLRLTRPVATLLDCGRVLGALDLAVVVGGAIDDGVDPAEIDAAAARRVRGAGQLRAARALLGERPESAMEVVLGAFCRTLRIPTETQRELRDGDDRFVARGDLWIAGTRTLVEYDGAVHLEPDAYADGLRRDRRINAEGWNRFAVTLSDLVGRSHRTARELYAAAGLEHDPARVRAWWDLLRYSGETPAGRAWLSARWAYRTNTRREAS